MPGLVYAGSVGQRMGATDARERMVSAAIELFGERGYGNVSLLEVIQRARAPRGSIYYYFPEGKAELGVEVATRMRHDVERQANLLASRADGPEEFLYDFIDQTRKLLIRTDYGQGCTMAGILANVDNSGPLRESVGETITSWIDSVAKGLVRRGVDPVKAKMVASNVISAVEGATVVSRATRSIVPFEQIKAMLSVLLAAD